MSDRKDPKLCEIIAVSKGTAAETQSTITKIHHTNKKPALFDGQERTFEPLDEADQLPKESTKVQVRAEDQVDRFVEAFSENLDVLRTRDDGNTIAKADIEIDGTTIVADVPATFLLALEKELKHVQTFFGELPELDPAETWDYDADIDLYRAESRKTSSKKKVQKPVQLAPATKEHPEQAELVSEDVLVGFWNTTKLSGAFSSQRKREILRRVSALIKAVKAARERANGTRVTRNRDTGKAIFGYLLGQ